MDNLGYLILTALVLVVVSLPRDWAVFGMVLGAMFLSQGLLIQIGTFNFFPTRILVYACFARVLIKRELGRIVFNKVDRSVILLYLFTTLVLFARGDESVMLRLAKMLDVLCGYFAFRALITTPDEFRTLLRRICIAFVPYVALVFVESVTHRNPFVYVGAENALWARGDRLRCFGSFRHPSLLGSLGASFFPLFVALYQRRAFRTVSIFGASLSVAVVLLSNSGGPLSAFAAGIVGLSLWPLRHKMFVFRWALIAIVGLAATFMNAPIWYLLARLSGVTGGTGWHRSYLIDVAVRHLDEWWLVGMPVQDTAGWFHNVIHSTGGADITNQYISFGLNAGIVALMLFIVLIYRCFSHLGKALWSIRQRPSREKDEEWLLWGMGAMLGVHVSNWLGIAYWDQFLLIWLLQAAALSSLAQFWLQRGPEETSDCSLIVKFPTRDFSEAEALDNYARLVNQ